MKRKLNLNSNIPKILVRVAFPLIIGFILLFTFDSIIQYGGQRESIAASAERYLIAQSLTHSSHFRTSSPEVISISASDNDRKSFDLSPSQSLNDLSIDAYTAVAKKALQLNPEIIVINWLHKAHPLSLEYLRPIKTMIMNSGHPEKFVIAYRQNSSEPLAEDFVSGLQIADATDCYYDIIAICSYMPSWDWMPQIVADYFWKNPPKHHVSSNLPHAFPNFIVNVPTNDSIPQFSFTEFMETKVAEFPKNIKGVFIGNWMNQRPEFRNDKLTVMRTVTASDREPINHSSKRSLLRSGVPFHLFWAQLAQMFAEGDTIAVPPKWLSNAVNFLIIALIIITLFWLGPVFSFGIFLLYSFLYPIINDYSVKYFRFYMPVFDTIFDGFIIFVGSLFVFLSYSAYKNWLLEAQQFELSESKDVKANFISLISHNLNTPVAKLRGLIDVMQIDQVYSGFSNSIAHCNFLVTRMQFTIRTALLNSTLEQEENHSLRPTGIRDLTNELRDSHSKNLARLGIELKLNDQVKNDAQIILDTRLVAHMIAVIASLANHSGTTTHDLEKKIRGSLDLNIQARDLKVSLNFSGPVSSESLQSREEEGEEDFESGLDFYERASWRLILGVLDQLEGRYLMNVVGPDKYTVEVYLRGKET